MKKNRLWMFLATFALPLVAHADETLTLEPKESSIEIQEEGQPTLFEALEMLIHKASEKEMRAGELDDNSLLEELASPVQFDDSYLGEES